MEINEGQVITLNVSEGGSGSEVSKAYVDAQDTKTLSSAKAYADTKVYDDTDIKAKIASKQDKLTAGDNITIVGNVISATGGGTGDVTQTYVNEHDATTLSSAKAYTDETVPTQVNTYWNAHKSELKGDKGDKGDKGEQGLQGEQGIQGIQGERGLQGLQGLKGDTGEQGIQGIQGLKGEQGIQGEKGADGAKGDKGEQGLQGIKGADGYSPVRTVDYWTDEDVASMKAYIDEQILGGKW